MLWWTMSEKVRTNQLQCGDSEVTAGGQWIAYGDPLDDTIMKQRSKGP